MKKSILNLNGVNELSKLDQQSINGGSVACYNPPNPGSGINQYGMCYYNPGCYTWVKCNEYCPDRTQPICAR